MTDIYGGDIEMYKDDEPTVECKYCGRLTYMLGTKLCDICWELESRIRSYPEIARKMLFTLSLEKKLRSSAKLHWGKWLHETLTLAYDKDAVHVFDVEEGEGVSLYSIEYRGNIYHIVE